MAYKNTKAIVQSRRSGTRLITVSQLRNARNNPVQLEPEAERRLMERNEENQRAHMDKFWGVDHENMHKRRNQELMYKEGLLSAESERLLLIGLQHQQWEQEFQQEAQHEAYKQAVHEMKTRSKYMKALFTSTSSDIVYTYTWDRSGLPESQKHDVQKPQGGSGNQRNAMRNSLTGDPTLTVINPDHIGTRNTFHLEGIQQARALSVVPGSVGKQGELGREQTLGPLLRGRATTPGIAQNNMMSMVEGDGASLASSSGMKKSQASSFLSMFGGNAEGLMFEKRPKKVITEEMKRASEAFEGHPHFKWDQELILRQVFDSLDTQHTGELYPSDISALSSNSQLQYLLSFTVFGSWVKKKQWTNFLTALYGSSALAEGGADGNSRMDPNPLDLGGAVEAALGEQHTVSFVEQGGWQDNSTSITVNRWFLTAMTLAKEKNKRMRVIRTDEEHLSLLTYDNNYHSLEGNSVDFAARARMQHDKMKRETELISNLAEGDVVWALHNGGCTWMPAVIEKINPDTLTCDVKFPLSQYQLRALRKKAAGAEILNGKASGRTLKNMLDSNVFTSRGPSAVYPGFYLDQEKMNVINRTLESNQGQEIHNALNTVMAYNLQ